MNENQTESEKIAEQVRAKLLQDLLARLLVLRDPPGLHLDEIEAAAHILNSLDPARSGVGAYLRAEKIETPTP